MSQNGEREDKPPMPQVFKELGEAAIARHRKRPATPSLEITMNNGGWWFASPFNEADEDHWVALMFEAFATRSQATFITFMTQLSELCSTSWNETENAWHPSEQELIGAVQIVRATKPRNEAEACLAAQMVAIHFMQMKLSVQALKHSYPDPRTCAIAGKLARTYATQLETMAKLKGKGSRQRITVRKYSQHEHKHVHLHQGAGENGNQPHGPRRARRTEIKAPEESSRSSSLPCAHSQEYSLPVSCNEGEDALPHPRRGEGVRGAYG